MVKTEIIDVKFRIAVKAFIIHKDRLLVIKRAGDDVQSPRIWEIPGGRLELGEDPYLGLIREIKEETGLYIKPMNPLSIRHFERADGQIITMIIYFCQISEGEIRLSEEHSEFRWLRLDESKDLLTDFFHKEVDVYSKLFSHDY